MAIMLSVYTDRAFREIRLPMLCNLDYSLTLYRNVYGLKKDLTLKMEIVGEEWKFLEDSD